MRSTTAMDIERDVILSPNQTDQIPGKVLYYDPNEFNGIDFNDKRLDKTLEYRILEQNEDYAWLKPLKYALYLVLNDKINLNSNKR